MVPFPIARYTDYAGAVNRCALNGCTVRRGSPDADRVRRGSFHAGIVEAGCPVQILPKHATSPFRGGPCQRSAHAYLFD